MEAQIETNLNETALWQALEQDRQVPDRTLLAHLSGLIGQELTRFTKAWSGLDNATRRDLVQLLSDTAEADWEMDFFAIFWLGLDDLDAGVRVAAIDGLHESEDIRLVPRYRRLLLQDRSANVRAAAATGLAQFVLLGELGKIRARPFENAIDALTQSYENPDEVREVRRRVIEALAYTGSEAIDTMITSAYQDSDLTMRTSAVFAMGRSGDDRWARSVAAELHNTAPEMRYEAARASGELKLERALSDIIELTEDTDRQVQEAALWALGQIGGRRAMRVLEQFRDGDDEAAAAAAHEALDELDFFKADPKTFFGPPEDFSGEGEGWDLLNDDDDDEDDDLGDLSIEDDEDLF